MPLYILAYTSTSVAVEGIVLGMAYENVAATRRFDDPIVAGGTEVQLYGLCQDGGGCADALRLLVVLLIPRRRSRVVLDLFTLLNKMEWSDSAVEICIRGLTGTHSYIIMHAIHCIETRPSRDPPKILYA